MIHYECSVSECNGTTGYDIPETHAEVFERHHGEFDEKRKHVLRKTGER